MNNKTYGSRPASRGYVNADGTIVRPRKPSGPPPSNAPQHKARAVYGAQPVRPTAPPRSMPPRPGTASGGAQRKPMPPRPQAGRPAAQPRPAANPGQKKRPPQGQRAMRPPEGRQPEPKRGTPRPPQRRGKSGWIYPEGAGGVNPASDFERYYRQRRQEELRQQRQRQERARQEALRQKKLRRKKRLAQVRGILARFIIVFALICGITAGAYFKIYHRGAVEKYNAVTFTIGKDDTFEAGASAAYYGGVLYTDFTRLASFLDMPMAGSIHYMRFIIPSKTESDSAGNGMEEAVLFAVGSSTANINGVNMNMTGPCRLIGTSIWVPLSFVEYYMSGVTVKYEKSDEITLTRTVVEDETNKDKKQEEKKTEPLTFRVKPQKPIDPVEYDPNAAT